ncbi:MAG: FeoA family protein [Abditibacteriaceae bacterium]
MRSLDQLKPGEAGVISSVTGEEDTLLRLMEMGLTDGTPITMVRYAPMGDPIEIIARGYHLSLRRAEASGVLLQDS